MQQLLRVYHIQWNTSIRTQRKADVWEGANLESSETSFAAKEKYLQEINNESTQDT